MYPYLATGNVVGQSLALDEEIDTKLMSQEDLQTAIFVAPSRWKNVGSPWSLDVALVCLT